MRVRTALIFAALLATASCGTTAAPTATVTVTETNPETSASTTEQIAQLPVPRSTTSGSHQYPPGTYRVPDDMPYGVYRAENVPGGYPGCSWSTWTADNLPIDVYNEMFTDGPFEASILSPAIARFNSSDGCTPWEKVS